MPTETTPTARITLMPWWTLAACTLAAGVWFLAGTSETLIYERDLVLSGQLWRLVTCHWVHFTGSHLFWNLVILGTAGSILERRNLRVLRRTLLFSPLAISLALLVLAPGLTRFAGISGVALSVLVALAVHGLRTEPRARWIWLGALGLAATTIGIECFAQHPLNPDLTAQAIVSVPLAHLVGAAVGTGVVLLQPRPQLHP